jgi:UDP-glucose 4-epimerase
MSKILVTGGSGFIGTHLCRQLTKAGHEVRVLDLVAPKTAVPGVHYERGDVRIASDVTRLIDGVDAVYHFAAMVSVPLCQQQPIESYQTNLMATCQILEAIRRESARQDRAVRLLFAGSSVVYGDLGQEGKATREEGPLDWPPSFYGAQKLGSEHAIELFHRTYKLPAVIYRFFNVYGPGQDPKSPYSGVISIFSQSIRDGKPLRLNASGTPTRDFVSVHDVARACAMGLDIPAAKCDAKAINLGTGRSVTIRRLAEEMIAAAKRNVPLENAPHREGDVLHSMADISRAKSVLGWTPRVSLAEGLSELVGAGDVYAKGL